MPKAQWVINGKFLSAMPTGVHRVAHELVRAIDQLLVSDPEIDAQFEFVIAAPRNILKPPAVTRIPVIQTGVLTWQFWEQISLPRFVGNKKLLSLCNLAPLWRTGVVMIHDAQVHISPKSYSRSFSAYYRAIQPLIAANAEKVLTVSSYSRDMLVKYGVAPAAKISVIANAGDHMLRITQETNIVRQLGLEGRQFAIGLATTQPHKNIGLLLRAFDRSELAKIPLVLIGGAGRVDFEEIGYRVPSNVVFAGRIEDECFRQLIENALCLLFPSTTEGFGLPPLEAMILGCPVICAPCGALPEVCADAANYASATDPADWVKAILDLAQRPSSREALAASGLQRSQDFCWEDSARQLLRLI